MKSLGLCAAIFVSTAVPVHDVENIKPVTVHCTLRDGSLNRVGSLKIGLAGRTKNTMKVTTPAVISFDGLWTMSAERGVSLDDFAFTASPQTSRVYGNYFSDDFTTAWSFPNGGALDVRWNEFRARAVSFRRPATDRTPAVDYAAGELQITCHCHETTPADLE